jgi:uncharacterized glyoxalase superfamily protein PhnB
MQRVGENRVFVRGTAGPHGLGLLPVMQYRDLGRAIAWLTRAFGFAEHEIVRAEDGAPFYALLSFDDALIMLGPVRDDEFGALIKQPDETGGAETQSCYLVVDDVDAHYGAAKAAGAAILFDIKPYDFGGRGYSCRDPEGHIWSFGTYDPWQKSAVPAGWRISIPLMPALVVVLGTIAAAGWLTAAAHMESPEATMPQPVAARPDPATTAALATERAARQRAERALEAASKRAPAEGDATQRVEHALDAARTHAAAERLARTRMKEALAKVSKQGAAERKARQDAERAAVAARDMGERQRDAKEKAERRLQQVRQHLERERRTLKTVQAELRAAGRAKEKAERTAQEALKRLAEIEARASATPPQGASKPKPQRKVTREAAEPMPALIP